MKTTLTTVMGAVALGMALFVSGPAWAGAKDTPQVTVGSSYAGGSMVGARYGQGKKQYIGCEYTVHWAGVWTSCSAKDKVGNSFLCFSSNSKWKEVLQTMTDSSYIYVTADNSGYCKYIRVENSSKYLR